jgi:hypothetical protein
LRLAIFDSDHSTSIRPTVANPRRNDKEKKPARIVGDLNMSTYLAASDETKNYEATGFVTYGGFFGPVEDWTNYFEPA